MLKEKNPLLKLQLKKDKKLITNIYGDFIEGFYALYDFILENPIENFWYECFNIILSYLQLISLAFSETVS